MIVYLVFDDRRRVPSVVGPIRRRSGLDSHRFGSAVVLLVEVAVEEIRATFLEQFVQLNVTELANAHQRLDPLHMPACGDHRLVDHLMDPFGVVHSHMLSRAVLEVDARVDHVDLLVERCLSCLLRGKDANVDEGACVTPTARPIQCITAAGGREPEPRMHGISTSGRGGNGGLR